MARRAPSKPYASLAAYMAATGLKQEQVARVLGIPQGQLSKYINGVDRPRPERAKRIAAALNIDVTSLLLGDVA